MTMSGPHLTVVPEETAGAEVYNLTRGPETTAQRLQRLQQEARQLAREEIEALERDLIALGERAQQIAHGGEAYAVGLREMASRLSSDLPQKAQSLRAILERSARD